MEIMLKYLMHKIFKCELSDIEWDSYPKDAIFSNLFQRKSVIKLNGIDMGWLISEGIQ